MTHKSFIGTGRNEARDEGHSNGGLCPYNQCSHRIFNKKVAFDVESSKMVYYRHHLANQTEMNWIVQYTVLVAGYE